MIDFRPVFLVAGILLVVLACAMCAPALVDAYYGHRDWQVFATAAAVTSFVGASLALISRTPRFRLSVRQAFVMTTISWLLLTVFASLPFLFSELTLSPADAFFEAMSGVTTTGSTVIVNLETVPPGILLWRGILQWLGGIGIIVMAIAVMPMLGVGGMQMFRVEAFETGEKLLPRAAQISAALTFIYVALTALWTMMLLMAGMDFFDAVIHAMTTIATGGFSSHNQSIGFYNSAAIDIVVIAGMLVGSLPFVLYLRTWQGDAGALARDTQVQWFFVIVLTASAAAAFFLWFEANLGIGQSIRLATFNVVSVMTGTGYTTSDFWVWGHFAGPIFFFLMFVGGCTGSTTCGIKIFRFQVLWSAAQRQFYHLLRPHGVFIPYYNHRPLPDEVITSVSSFFFVFGVCFALLTIGLAMLGLDFVTAISSAATAICNVGPGLGSIVGPSGTFQELPEEAKWLLSAGMLLGRLELFTVLILLSPAFWRG